MSNRRKSSRYRLADKDELRKIVYIGYPLEELFNKDELSDLLAIARQRVVGEFFHATEWYRGRYVCTDNYIIGVGSRLSELRRYVVKTMHRRIVRTHHLPQDMQDLHPKMIDMITQRADHELVQLILQAMLNYDVWYDDARGIWQVSQSAMDEFHSVRHATSNTKIDVRVYHGRVRSQSKARGIPGGTSIGVA